MSIESLQQERLIVVVDVVGRAKTGKTQLLANIVKAIDDIVGDHGIAATTVISTNGHTNSRLRMSTVGDVSPDVRVHMDIIHTEPGTGALRSKVGR